MKDKHKTSCDKCHKTEKTYLGLSTDCFKCHTDVHKKTLDQDCLKCHDFKSWKSISFDHDKYSTYALTGKHIEAKCEGCHPEQSVEGKMDDAGKTFKILVFKPLKSEKCSDCHFDVHKGELKEKSCSNCHSTNEWKEMSFEHNNKQLSNYKLEGKHQNVSCGLCHIDEKLLTGLKESPTEKSAKKLVGISYGNCSDCHFDIHKGQFKDQKCESCHTVQQEWKQYTFKHESDQYRGYKLEGKHGEVSCETCHARSDVKFSEFNKTKKVSIGIFRPIKSDNCNNCHSDKVHGDQFPTNKCENCHTVTQEWKQYTFKHESDQYKGYKLEGKHSQVECEKCHVRSEVLFSEFNKEKRISAGKFRPLEYKTCLACHEDVHKGKYEQSCSYCHSPDSWEPKEFIHDPVSFELKGAHRTLTCKQCHEVSKITHTVQDYAGLESDCSRCHRDQHMNQFDQFCSDCHMQSAWIPVIFKHSGVGFRLSGAHRSLDCDDCHFNNDYRSAATDCYICHASDHSKQHPSYSQDCTQCHSENAWLPAKTSHQSFQLRGIHASLDCLLCHKSGYPGQYAGTSEDDCYTCHANDHSQQHPSFPQDCRQCHSENAWLPASQSHQYFNLIGVHATLNCEKCHQSGYPGQYAGVSEDDCFVCHESNYYKKHQTCPQDCTRCHNIFNWGNPDKALRDSLGCK